jgi:hypothetical protein
LRAADGRSVDSATGAPCDVLVHADRAGRRADDAAGLVADFDSTSALPPARRASRVGVSARLRLLRGIAPTVLIM